MVHVREKKKLLVYIKMHTAHGLHLHKLRTIELIPNDILNNLSSQSEHINTPGSSS